ncbi:hypothetical protein EDB87DRAFT_1577417 [Lactarius vividus]|nr:hypothetical protein EDB87DRAFT_1577417 [Lactarius vividus]
MSGTENDIYAGLFRPQQESQTPEPNSLRDVLSKESAHLGKDPSLPVEGMYPRLELITEQGSSGLVDKTIISQQSLQDFINALSPEGSTQESLASRDGWVTGVSEPIPQPPSFIPLLSPKSARNPALSSSLPSSLLAPQLGLVHPNRTPTGSGSPSRAPYSPQALSTHASGDSSLPSLRILRSLFPFGSGKPASGAATSGPLRNSFASFSPVRRSSTTTERKNSGQFSRPVDDSDEAAISIVPHPPHQASLERTRDASSSPRIFPHSRAVTPQSRLRPLSFFPADASPSSPTGSARSQHSPVRTTTRSGLVRSVPTKFVPRLVLSAADNAPTGRGDRDVESFSRTPSDSTLQSDEGRGGSIDGVYIRRSPASPLPLEFRSQPSLQQTHTEQHRHVASSRLATSTRFRTHTSGAIFLLHSALSSSPTSRASSSLGAAADCLNRPRTSEVGALGARPSACERPGYIPRSRNRSLGVGDGNGESVTSPGSRTAAEWLGPRTVKAFAAAGLLERDRDPSNSMSRFGSTQSLGDRDQRALSPTRLAQSEASSVASAWRSASREMMHSDATGSTSTGARRTTRSAESTASTSISMSHPESRTPSLQHKGYLVALHAMKDKHATETGTLLADAQHISRSPRTETARVMKRMDDLEAQLVAAHHTQLRAQQPLARFVFSRVERQNSTDAPARRCPPPPVMPLSSRVLDTSRQEDADAEDATSRPASNSESVFALPLPKMSTLLREQPTGLCRSASSVSPTTAGAATDEPRSPRGLFLRPEHELHLGDMGRG